MKECELKSRRPSLGIWYRITGQRKGGTTECNDVFPIVPYADKLEYSTFFENGDRLRQIFPNFSAQEMSETAPDIR
jgi:hypothetical protein